MFYVKSNERILGGTQFILHKCTSRRTTVHCRTSCGDSCVSALAALTYLSLDVDCCHDSSGQLAFVFHGECWAGRSVVAITRSWRCSLFLQMVTAILCWLKPSVLESPRRFLCHTSLFCFAKIHFIPALIITEQSYSMPKFTVLSRVNLSLYVWRKCIRLFTYFLLWESTLAWEKYEKQATNTQQNTKLQCQYAQRYAKLG